MLDYSYIKDKHRQPAPLTGVFTGLRFRRAAVTKVPLTWPQRWISLAGLLSPRHWWMSLRYEWRWRLAEFRTGWSYKVDVK